MNPAFCHHISRSQVRYDLNELWFWLNTLLQFPDSIILAFFSFVELTFSPWFFRLIFWGTWFCSFLFFPSSPIHWDLPYSSFLIPLRSSITASRIYCILIVFKTFVEYGSSYNCMIAVMASVIHSDVWIFFLSLVSGTRSSSKYIYVPFKFLLWPIVKCFTFKNLTYTIMGPVFVLGIHRLST